MVRLPQGSVRVRRAVARLAALGAGLVLVAAPVLTPAAHADTGALNLTCATPIGDQAFTAVVHGTAPETAAVGDTVALSNFTADVTVNESLTGVIYAWLGIRSMSGSVGVPTTVDDAGTAVPQASTSMAIPATEVPAAGALTVSASADGGAGPAFVTDTAGTVTFQVGSTFTADLVGTNEAGDATPISTTCTLDPGQDPTIASVTVS